MKNVPSLLSLLCCVPLLQSCESVPPSRQAWGFQPLLQVRHADQSPQGYYQLGRYYQGQSRNDLAIQAFLQVLVLDKNHAEAHNALGSLYAGQRQFELAIKEFQLALSIAPGAAHIYNNLGYTYYLQGRPLEAASALQQASSLQPGDAKILNNLNLALALKSKTELVQQAFTPATMPLPSETANHIGHSMVMQSATPSTVPATSSEALNEKVNVSLPPPSTFSGRMLESDQGSRAQHLPHQLPAESNKVVEPSESTMLSVAPSGLPKGGSTMLPSAKYEVSNGNGINGMAKRVSQALLAQGYPAARLTNSKPYHQAATVIEYRPGYAGVAAKLSASLPLQPAIAEKTGLRPSADVRLLLGRDVMNRIALVTPREQETKLALGATKGTIKP